MAYCWLSNSWYCLYLYPTAPLIKFLLIKLYTFIFLLRIHFEIEKCEIFFFFNTDRREQCTTFIIALNSVFSKKECLHNRLWLTKWVCICKEVHKNHKIKYPLLQTQKQDQLLLCRKCPLLLIKEFCNCIKGFVNKC